MTGEHMKRRFTAVLTMISMLVCTLIMPVINASAVSEKVKLYGNSISADAKQVCFVRGKKDDPVTQYLTELYAPEFKTYRYIDYETELDCKVIAKKLPQLQKLVIISCDVANPEALSKLNDLMQLGLYGCGGTEDMSFLKKITGLKKLWYAHSYCDDISPVASLKNLTELYIKPSKFMDDISAVGSLTKLKKLDLSGRFSDISVLSKLTNLETLSLESGKVKDLSPIGKLTKLKNLSLAGMREASGKPLTELKLKNLRLEYVGWKMLGYLEYMSTVENLGMYNMGHMGYAYLSLAGKMPQLKVLTIDDARLSQCDFVSGLENLESLTLTSNKIADFAPLKNLKKLKYLDISNNYGEKYDALLKIKGLEELNIKGCGLDDDLVKKYKKANPDCIIDI